jgi:hypothetical protein
MHGRELHGREGALAHGTAPPANAGLTGVRTLPDCAGDARGPRCGRHERARLRLAGEVRCLRGAATSPTAHAEARRCPSRPRRPTRATPHSPSRRDGSRCPPAAPHCARGRAARVLTGPCPRAAHTANARAVARRPGPVRCAAALHGPQHYAAVHARAAVSARWRDLNAHHASDVRHRRRLGTLNQSSRQLFLPARSLQVRCCADTASPAHGLPCRSARNTRSCCWRAARRAPFSRTASRPRCSPWRQWAPRWWSRWVGRTCRAAQPSC